MTKNIVETKPEDDVIANLLLYLHICEKVGFIYVPNSHQVRITYDNQNRLKKKRSYHEKRVQVANVTYRVGGRDGADVLRGKVQLDGKSQEERSSGLHCKFSGAYHICIDIFLSDFSKKYLTSQEGVDLRTILLSFIYRAVLGRHIPKTRDLYEAIFPQFPGTTTSIRTTRRRTTVRSHFGALPFSTPQLKTHYLFTGCPLMIKAAK